MHRVRSLPLILLILALTALVFAACSSSTPEPTPTPTPAPVEETPAPEGVVPETEDHWERIQAAGKMVIGTSADYPPFEYYNDNFELDGYDIALMEAVGEVLGLEIEFKDIAFDGLGDAVILGQIDAAIAAISLTVEREEVLDFSQIYFVSEDAYLAAAESRVGSIETVEDLAAYRVGVQRGSVFQDWLEDELVSTGLMSATDLFVYSQIQEALPDLEANRVDVLVLDLQPAELGVQELGLELVGQGLNRERYAIAMTKGQNTLRNRINQALLTLSDDGVLDDLAQEYLNLDPEDLIPLPTPTPQPPTPTPLPQPATPTPLPRCLDGMAWEADLTFDDQNMQNVPVLQPGQPFQKGWRVRNTGTCTWDSNYTLTYVQGNQPGARMGGQPTSIQGTVAPGQTYDLYVDLVAPLRPGLYQGIWQMRNGNGSPFGERLWVAVQVPSGPAPTPAPTQTPSAGIEFYTDRDNIRQGECTVNHWRTQNVQEVYYYQEGQNWQNNGVAGTGDRQECPSQNTNYYLRVVKRDNSIETRQITIRVEQSANAPNIARFTVDPSGQISVGQCVTLRWDVQGSVDRVKITRNNSNLWDGAPFRGSYQDCPPGTGDMAYRLEATGPGGTSQATQHVRVVEGPAPTATPEGPTPTPQPTRVPEPVINGFSATPSEIQVNQCVNIAWSTGGGTETVNIFRNNVIVQDSAGLNGSIQDCLSQAGTYVYQVQASNRVGSTVTQDATVGVGEPAPTATPVPPQAPVINSFSAQPQQIPEGQCVTLSWDFTGVDLVLAQVFRGGDVIATDVPSPGSTQDCPPGTGTVEYRLQVDAEFGGSAQQSAFVDVVGAVQPTLPAPTNTPVPEQPTDTPAPPPTDTPVPEQPPVITSFTANPLQIDLNNSCTTLEWSFTGTSIVGVSLTRNGQPIAGPDVGSPYQDCVDAGLAGQNLTYELRVDSEFAGSATQQLTVQFIAG